MPIGLARARGRARTEQLDLPDAQPLLPRLSGAGSLRTELEALLAAAPPDATPATFRELILDANVTGKRSASARLWVWKRIKLRYILDPAVAEYRVFRAALNASGGSDERGLVCLLMFARTDRLFREVVLECVSPLLQSEGTLIEPATVDAAIRLRAEAGRREWSANTLDRAHKHLLAALKDFGVLRGSASKRTVRPRPRTAVALFGAQLARLEGLTDRQTLDARWFRLLGLDADRVVDLLYSANSSGALGFRMQADVVELTLPPLEAA
jgi:hypothetical protein